MTSVPKYVLKQEGNACILRQGKTLSFHFDADAESTQERHRLFFNCEDVSTPAMKNESGAELLYLLIDDSLNIEMAERDRYCLDFSASTPLPFPKRAVKKILWQPLTYGLYGYDTFTDRNDTWELGISVRAKNLKKEAGGYLRFRYERWSVKEGGDPRDTREAPDETVFLDIPTGTYAYTAILQTLCIGSTDTACVTVTLEGEGYTGEVYFEQPCLRDGAGRNLLPAFERGNLGLASFAWLGQNLSKREWPRFRITLNDTLCFEDEVFLKVHRFSPIEIPVPCGVLKEGNNTLSITYTSDYLEALPLAIDEVLLLEGKKEAFSLIHTPASVVWGEELALLVETEARETEILFESSDFTMVRETRFDDVDLRVLTLLPVKEKNGLSFSLSAAGEKKHYTVERCVRRAADGVRAGSGDMIYIDVSDKAAVVDYLKWYVAHGIGKLLTVRQVYRWGGQRHVNAAVWSLFTALCDALHIDYVLISDGRDLPSIATNPTLEMMAGERFLGRQLHERDGQLFYWTPADPREVMAPLDEFFDLAARLGREHPNTVEGAMRPFNLRWGEAGCTYRRNKSTHADVKEAHDVAAHALRELNAGGFPRHTGPAVMFKYFYQNGFDFAGFESMDGSTEVPLSFLRGASKAYGKKTFGAHLALQWSTFPHDTEGRYRRYLLSLFVPYLHGVTDINTEEGLWYMEAFYAYHHRLSEPCRRHREQLACFNDFVDTHARTGKLHTPIAFLHGRCDGWDGFSSENVFGMPFMKVGEAGASWKLLQHFYPLDSCESFGTAKTGYISAEHSKPFGIFSGTPNGCVDAVPVETGDFADYKLLIFAGYNLAEAEDLDRLLAFVHRGGTLLCAWPHLSDTTDHARLTSHAFHIFTHPMTALLSEGEASFVPDTVEGNELFVAENVVSGEILRTTDTGRPLVTAISHGAGKLVLVNALCYPAHPAVFSVYRETVASLTARVLDEEPLRVSCGTDVEYTVFRQADGTRHYYFLAVDWYNGRPEPRRAVITIDGASYELQVPFGAPVKLVTDGKSAVWPMNAQAEVLSLTDRAFLAQGAETETFFVARGGKITAHVLDFSDACHQKADL